MQLSRFSDYSLRVLFYTATNNHRLCQLAEIADFFDISVEHLRKVVHGLAKSGYLETFRGKKGGIRLAVPSADINLAEIVALTEGMRPLVDCTGQECCLSPACGLKNILAQAQTAMMRTLAQYSVADILDDPQMQSRLIATSR